MTSLPGGCYRHINYLFFPPDLKHNSISGHLKMLPVHVQQINLTGRIDAFYSGMGDQAIMIDHEGVNDLLFR